MMTLSEKARIVHKDSIIIDALEINQWGGEIFRRMRKGGLTAVNCTVCVLENFRQTMANIAWWDRAFELYGDLIIPIFETADIRRAKEQHKTGIILGFQNTSAIEDDLDWLRIYYALGVRIIQLTYMEGNLVGQGCLERVDAGLTEFGLEVIEEMNRLGILIDLSHVGYQTTMEAIEASEKPVVFTHANPKGVHEHPRNKPDEAIKALARNGGVIGATIFPLFLPSGNQSTIRDVIDVVDFLVEMVGIDHVAIGTDFTVGQPREFFDWILTGKSKKGPALELDYPIRNPKGIEGPEDFPNLTAALLERGYAVSDVKKIMGENMLRLFEDVWRV